MNGRSTIHCWIRSLNSLEASRGDFELTMSLDRRGRTHKYILIMSRLAEYGYEEKPIPDGLLERVIVEITGADTRRTIIDFKEKLLQRMFLAPVDHRKWRKHVRKVDYRTKSGLHARQYEVFNGYEFYWFGVNAPKFVQETLNPIHTKVETVIRLPSPASPTSSRESEAITVSKPRNNMHSAQGNRTVQKLDVPESDLPAFLEEDIENREKRGRESGVSYTHCLDTVGQKDKKKRTADGSSRDTSFKRRSLDTIVSKIVSQPASTVSKLCPRCGVVGTGPHYRNVPVKGRIYRYPYFSHFQNGQRRWCYLSRKLLARQKFLESQNVIDRSRTVEGKGLDRKTSLPL